MGARRKRARERLPSVVTAIPECVAALIEVGADLVERDPGLAGDRAAIRIELEEFYGRGKVFIVFQGYKLLERQRPPA